MKSKKTVRKQITTGLGNPPADDLSFDALSQRLSRIPQGKNFTRSKRSTVTAGMTIKQKPEGLPLCARVEIAVLKPGGKVMSLAAAKAAIDLRRLLHG